MPPPLLYEGLLYFVFVRTIMPTVSLVFSTFYCLASRLAFVPFFPTYSFASIFIRLFSSSFLDSFG